LFTRAHCQSFESHVHFQNVFKIHFNIVIPTTPTNPQHITLPLRLLSAVLISAALFPSSLDHINKIRCRVQFTKLLIMQFSPFSPYFPLGQPAFEQFPTYQCSAKRASPHFTQGLDIKLVLGRSRVFSTRFDSVLCCVVLCHYCP
jgi:hypothetical protein